MDTVENILDAVGGLAEILNNLISAGEAVSTIGCAILAVIALANCFFGYKLLKFWCTLNGGVIGLIISIVIGNYFDIVRPIFWQPTFAVCIILLCITLFAYLGFKIYKLGIFFMTSIPPLLILLLLTREPLIAIISAVVIGIIAVCLTRFVVIVSYSIGYGMLAGGYIVGVFGSNNIGVGILIGVVISVLAIMYQWKTTGIKAEKEVADKSNLKVTSLIRTNDTEENKK